MLSYAKCSPVCIHNYYCSIQNNLLIEQLLVYVTVYVISELSLPPLNSGAVQERETLVLVTLDTVTLRGADGDSANDEKIYYRAVIMSSMCL